jgi:predicted dehydrogenase
MDNGARLLYNASWCAKGAFCGWDGNWQIECENGTLVMKHGEVKVLRVPELYKVEGEEKVDLIDLPLQGQQYVLDEFIRAAHGERVPATAAADNIKSIGMVFATVEAMESGRTVDIPG